MSLKKFGIALIAVLALSALVVSSSSAAVKTVAAQWYTGAGAGVTLPVTESRAASGAVATHPVIGAKATFATTIGGLEVDLTSTVIECVSCEIKNKAVNGAVGTEPTTTSNPAVIAWGTGKIRFKNVTVMEEGVLPNGCTVSNPAGGAAGVIETNQLVIHGDWMDTTEANKKAFIQFLPKTGPAGIFASFHIDEVGDCEPITGTYNVTGSVFGESANDTGVGAATQNLVFSPTVQATTGAALKVGAGTATFTGTGAFSIGGENFQVK